MKPRVELKALVMSAAAKEASPTRRAVELRRALAWLGAGLWVLLVFGGLGGMRAVERPVSFVLGTAVGWAVVALLVSWGSSRGRSMLGRPRAVILAMAVATPLLLEAWYVAALVRSDVTVVASPVLASLFCAAATLAMALAPFALLLRGRKGADPIHPRVTGAAMGAVSGAWAAVLIDLHCERVDVGHVTLGHVLPVVVLALVGAALGGVWLRVRGVEAVSSRGTPD